MRGGYCMYLKKLTQNGLITVDFYTNGAFQTLTGRVYDLNLKDQLLSLEDEKQMLFSIRLSSIKHIY